MAVYSRRQDARLDDLIDGAIEAEMLGMTGAGPRPEGPHKLLAIGEVIDGVLFPFPQPLLVDPPREPPQKAGTDEFPMIIDLIEFNGIFMTREDAIAAAQTIIVR